MRSLVTALRRGSWRGYAAVAGAVASAVVLYAWVDLKYSLPWDPHRPTFLTFPSAPLAGACDGVDDATSQLAAIAAANSPIPNLVHYVWLLGNPAVFSLGFSFFVSVYSAHLFLRPDRIYIHTDASRDVWDRAKDAGDTWTRRVLGLPGVTPNFVATPRRTSLGHDIDTFGAKSDFVRGDALRNYGGVYLDSDAVPLRDLAPLRRAGFASVVGGQMGLMPKHTGFVNTGVWLSRPHASLVEIYTKAMDAFYNGVWAISVDILSDLVYRLHAMPGEVLILHERAFSPVSWELPDQTRLYAPYSGFTTTTPLPNTNSTLNAPSAPLLDEEIDILLPDPTERPGEPRRTCEGALAWLRAREQLGRPGGGATSSSSESWEMDFSATYVLHAFDGDIDKIAGWDGKITLPYVLAQQSNYARAVYPAVWHAIRAGVIPVEETV